MATSGKTPSHALADHIEELATAPTGTPPSWRERAELRFRAKGSLSVAFIGDRTGQFSDHEAGVGGNALEMVK